MTAPDNYLPKKARAVRPVKDKLAGWCLQICMSVQMVYEVNDILYYARREYE